MRKKGEDKHPNYFRVAGETGGIQCERMKRDRRASSGLSPKLKRADERRGVSRRGGGRITQRQANGRFNCRSQAIPRGGSLRNLRGGTVPLANGAGAQKPQSDATLVWLRDNCFTEAGKGHLRRFQ
jgi:hypothetical protein